jgi:hypothetical protein
MSFKSLKTEGSLLEKLNKEINKVEGVFGIGSGYVDERLWKPTMGKEGVGSAIIRFLPPSEGSDMPWSKVWSHAFKGPGGWYIENSLTTLGHQDPVSEANRLLWNSGLDSDKEVARKQKRKLSYYSNIYVIDDPANPQNEGQVFLYKYGKKIHDKIIASMQPEFKGQEPVNPFDLWQGADFNLRIKEVAGFWNYDSSAFGNPSTLGRFDDEQLEEIYNKMYDLNEFTGDSNFKSYDELKTRLDTVLRGRAPAPEVRDEEREVMPVPAAMKEELSTLNSGFNDHSSEDTYSYFDSLANEEM